MRRLFFIVLLGLVLLPSGAFSAADSSAPSINACTDAINSRLGHEQRLYRRILFGLGKASDEATNAVRYDNDGTAWIKASYNRWVTQDASKVSRTFTDAQMDSQTERDPLVPASAQQRAGIFETKGVLTSELIPSLTQTFRAFECRTQALCDAVQRSVFMEDPGSDGVYAISVPGCRAMPEAPLAACRFGGGAGGTDDIGAQGFGLTHCQPAATVLLDREEQQLKLAVSYDAATRSLYQFAGNFDAFLGSFGGDIIDPLRQSLSLVSELGRIPCFLAQCNQ